MKVTVPVLLRLSALVTLVFAAGHMSGAVDSWAAPGTEEVVQRLREVPFQIGGATRTYWHFYYGFGIYIGVLLTLQSVLLWQLGSLAVDRAARIRPMLVSMCAASAVGTLVVWSYIFIVPALFSLASTVCIAAALLAARDSRSGEGRAKSRDVS
jgi:hypothetical protein